MEQQVVTVIFLEVMVVVSTDKIAQQIMLVKHLVVRNFLVVTEELHIKITETLEVLEYLELVETVLLTLALT